jgi:hypothetical protein
MIFVKYKEAENLSYCSVYKVSMLSIISGTGAAIYTAVVIACCNSGY